MKNSETLCRYTGRAWRTVVRLVWMSCNSYNDKIKNVYTADCEVCSTNMTLIEKQIGTNNPSTVHHGFLKF